MVRPDRSHLYARAKQYSEEKEYEWVIHRTAVDAWQSASSVGRYEAGLVFRGPDRSPETALSPALERIHVGVKDRREVQRDELRKDEAPDNGQTERPA